MSISTWRHYWVKIWHWQDAPSKYKKMYSGLRQPDWVAVISKTAARSQRYKYIPWLEEGFGSIILRAEAEDGSVVYLGINKGPQL